VNENNAAILSTKWWGMAALLLTKGIFF